MELFGPKTTSHHKHWFEKNAFPRSDLRCSNVQVEDGLQGHPVFQHLPVLCVCSTFCDENYITWQTWPKKFRMHYINILGQVYNVKWFWGQKMNTLGELGTCCKQGWTCKPGLACTWPWSCPKFFLTFCQKIKSATMLVHHVKGQPAASTCVRKKHEQEIMVSW